MEDLGLILFSRQSTISGIPPFRYSEVSYTSKAKAFLTWGGLGIRGRGGVRYIHHVGHIINACSLPRPPWAGPLPSTPAGLMDSPATLNPKSLPDTKISLPYIPWIINSSYPPPVLMQPFQPKPHSSNWLEYAYGGLCRRRESFKADNENGPTISVVISSFSSFS